jgi:CMP-N,N'-diacetyllegionaminic acid synthase
MKHTNVIAVIPARAGSKGLPGKNIRNLGGKPVMAHSIEAAVNCTDIDAVYVNSDSNEYLEIGESYGAIPYKRPAHLASDTTTMTSVVSAFIGDMNHLETPCDAVLVLYPTYPFRSPEQLTDIIEYFFSYPNCSSVVGLKKPDTHPYLCCELDIKNGVSTLIPYDINKFYRRQDYPTYFELSAWALMISSHNSDNLNAQMLDEKSKGYVIPDTAVTLDIDTSDDFEYARYLILNKNGL